MRGWSEWRAVEPAVPCSSEDLGELLGGGQAFRWHRVEAGHWRGSWARFHAELRSCDGAVQWRAPEALANVTAPALVRYLATAEDWNGHRDTLPWRSDPALRQAMEAWPDLRILRQPFGEALLCFLCSSAKQIPHIQRCVDTMANRFGEEFAPGIHALPTWDVLHRVSETELRTCGLGYRARYIHATARALAAEPGWLDVVEHLPTPEAKARLMELPGVGAKIADCTLLFGAGRLEAFPVDTWIAQVMAHRYGLDNWSPAQIVRFGQAHFGAAAGLAQQCLFASARRGARANGH